MDIFQWYELSRSRSGVAYFPFIDSIQAYIRVSTRNGNMLVKWGDGTEQQFTPSKNVDSTVTEPSILLHTYSVNYTGDVQVVFRQGLRDVYSISFLWSNVGGGSSVNYKSFNIQDIKTFFAQFPNLYSVYFDIYSYQKYTTVIKGDFSQLPDSVERVKFTAWEVKNNGVDQWLNLSNYSTSSKLKYFNFSREYIAQPLKIIGDLAKLPPLVTFFKVVEPTTGGITYTAGKVWASAFDTLSIPLPLSHTELDSLLADMDNSIMTKIGAGIITIGGQRSAASDAHVASLQAKGFTVNILRQYKLLDLPLQNSFADAGEIGMTIVAGGTSNQPTFALSGRKAGEYCAVFNGSQSIKTTTNLPINSDKVTIAFWMKTTQTSIGVIAMLSSNYNSANSFTTIINDLSPNKIYIADHTTAPSGYNIGNSAVNINDGNWFHVVMTIDRNLGVTQNQIYINGSLSYTQNASYVANLVGNFVNNILFIGQQAGNSLGFNGSLTKLKIYNYPFTATEVSNLYNSEL